MFKETGSGKFKVENNDNNGMTGSGVPPAGSSEDLVVALKHFGLDIERIGHEMLTRASADRERKKKASDDRNPSGVPYASIQESWDLLK
jgi:hypothetical protein